MQRTMTKKIVRRRIACADIFCFSVLPITIGHRHDTIKRTNETNTATTSTVRTHQDKHTTLSPVTKEKEAKKQALPRKDLERQEHEEER